jgi:hypothetical protein
MIRATVLLLAAFSALRAGGNDTLSPVTQNSAGRQFFESLLMEGRCDLAALEYERLLHDRYEIDAGISCDLGEALLTSGNFDKAEYAFENALAQAGTDPASYATAKFGIARTYLMQRKPMLALDELNTFDTAGATLDKDRAALYASAVYAASYSIDSAQKYLGAVTTTSRYTSKAKRLDTLLDWYTSRGMKNPLTAYLYSSAIPGWGHWYIGDRKKAAKSFLLMAGLSGLLCYEGYHFYRGDLRQRYIRGMDIFLLWGLAWRRYYGGIRKAAHQQAVEYNQNVQLEYQERLRAIIAE